MTTRYNILFFTAVLLFTFFASCSEGEVYFRFQHIDEGRWYQDSVLIFRMDSMSVNPEKRYDVTIELSTGHTYLYRDIWLHLDQNLTDSVSDRDTLHCWLADKYGKWLGPGVGGLNQLSVPYLTAVSLDTSRVYELRIRQAMTDDPLPGVEKVGIKVIEAGTGER